MSAFVAPSLLDIRAAAARIAAHARVTPILRSNELDALAGAKLYFKCEHLQVGGAFKFRGACNAVWALDEAAAARGVVTHSSGNHGAALALAARSRGIPSQVVVPAGAVATKLANIERAGGVVHRCAASLAAREEACARVQRETGATLVHPYADAAVIAGQGTVVLELVQQVPALDAVIVPIGGGGLAAGSAIALAALAPGTALLAAEPSGADDAWRFLHEGERTADVVPVTLCDGLRASLGEPNFAVLRQHAVEVIRVADAATLAAMRRLRVELKQVVEPSSAIVLAALLQAAPRMRGQRIGLVLSGGNVDSD